MDLAITTDHREVLAEILFMRLGNCDTNCAFPGVNFTGRLGLFGTINFGPSGLVMR